MRQKNLKKLQLNKNKRGKDRIGWHLAIKKQPDQQILISIRQTQDYISYSLKIYQKPITFNDIMECEQINQKDSIMLQLKSVQYQQ